MKDQSFTASRDLVRDAGPGSATVRLPGPGEPSTSEKVVDILWLLWGTRAFLVRAVCVGFVTACLIAFLVPKQYTSTTKLMPPDRDSSAGMEMLAALAGKGSSALATLGGQVLGMKTTGDLFIGILQSRTVQDDLIGKFDLKKVYGVSRLKDARDDLSVRTEILQDRKSGIIAIAVTDRSPQRAAGLAQQYVVELNNVVTNLNTSSAHKERVFLQDRLDEVKQSLEAAENDFSQFASKNTTIDIQEQGKAMLQAGAALEGELIATQTELEGLRQIYTDNNVRVRATEARLEELRRQLEKISGGPDTSTSNSADDPDPSEPYPSIRKLPLLGVNYADLYRRMKVQEAVFETLTQQYELARVKEAKETPTVQVLDSADVPEQKSSPHRWIIVLIGTFLSVSFAVVWIVGKHRWGALDPLDPRKALAQEALDTVRAIVPWARRNGFRSGGGHAE